MSIFFTAKPHKDSWERPDRVEGPRWVKTSAIAMPVPAVSSSSGLLERDRPISRVADEASFLERMGHVGLAPIDFDEEARMGQ